MSQRQQPAKPIQQQYEHKENVETVQQQSYTERLKEHRRRLNLLKERNDPVLLASDVFSKEILCKKYNITTECKVHLRKLDINIKSRKMKLSTALKILQTPNENKTHSKYGKVMKSI